MACSPTARPPLRETSTHFIRSSETRKTYREVYNTSIYEEEDVTESSDSSDEYWQHVESSLKNRGRSNKEHNLEDTAVTSNNSPQIQQKHNSKTMNSQAKRSHTCVIVIAGVIILVCILCAHSSILRNHNDSMEIDSHARMQKLTALTKSVKKIQSEICDQKSDTWDDILFGMYNFLLHPKKLLIINLFSSDSQTMNCLAKSVGEIGVNILGTNGYLSMAPEEFGNDVGEVIHTLKPKIEEKRVIIVQDLQRINAQAIKAFHNFCDRECPLVESTIYIITTVVDNYNSSRKEVEFIERKLYEVFAKHIEPDILNPLVTRILDGAVIHVKPCQQMKTCALH